MTKIEWTERTWNPTTGCDRVSPGCDRCYALTMAARLKAMGQPKYQTDGDPRTSGPGFGLAVHRDVLDLPLTWRKPSLVFVDSMSDLFHPDVSTEFIVRVWTTMARTPHHTYQVLTKRPQRAKELVWRIQELVEVALLRAGEGSDWQTPEYPDNYEGWLPNYEGWLPNVWLGTSIENDRYVWRANHLRATPAAVRFLSLEPLLGPLPSLDLTGIDWVIVGGESGPGARPMHPDWVRDIRDRCVAAGIPFFFKQWGAWSPTLPAAPDWTGGAQYVDTEGKRSAAPTPGAAFMQRLGKKAAGRLLDGRTWDEMPAVHRGA